jgi:hypothetical protein
MHTDVMLLDCPAYLDDQGAVRCGLPAAVEYRYTVESTDGPLESARIRCPRGHGLNGPVEFLTFTGGRQTLSASATGTGRTAGAGAGIRVARAADGG